jgi:hypothetical protein
MYKNWTETYVPKTIRRGYNKDVYSKQEYKSKKVFITFGGGAQNYYDAGNRLVNQVKKLNLFDESKLYTDIDLKNDKYFWNKHSNFIENNKKGYGFWMWKSYLIKKEMDNMVDGDILLYLDAGCEVDYRKKELFKDYFNYVKQDYIIGSQLQHQEKTWTKMDLIKYLNMEDYLNTGQREGGINMFYVNDKTRMLVNEWYKISSMYNLIDGSKSISKNDPSFKEHRHDQSIFSLLTKKYKIFSNKNINDIVEVIRNKSGTSKIQ